MVSTGYVSGELDVASHLAGLLEKQRVSILGEWQRSGARSGRVRFASEAATRRVMGEAFDGLVALLRSGEQEPMERFLTAAASRGVLAGVDAAEAVNALLVLKRICLQEIRAEEMDPARLLSAWEQLDEATGWAVARFSTLYARRVSEVLADQISKLSATQERLQFQAAELALQRHDLERRVREIDALRRSAAEVNSSLEPDRVLALIAEHAARLMETNRCVIYDWDSALGRLRGRTAVGMEGGAVERIAAAVSLDSQEVGAVIEGGRPLAIPDLAAAEARLPAKALATAREEGIRAALAAPLVAHGRLFGYLVTYYAFPRAFEEHEVALLSTFAEHGAMALQNAELFAESRRLAAAEERNRLAREVHDTLAQSLSGLVLQLESLDRALGRDPLRDRQELAEAIAGARQALREARRSVWDLRDQPLRGTALVEAVRAETERLAGEQTNVEFGVEGDPERLRSDAGHHLHRIAQEALANVRRHAQARQVWVSLRFAASWAELLVMDDGVGFSAADGLAERGGQFGLIGMRERTRMLGGSLEVESEPGQGTRVIARVPLATRNEAKNGD